MPGFETNRALATLHGLLAMTVHREADLMAIVQPCEWLHDRLAGMDEQADEGMMWLRRLDEAMRTGKWADAERARLELDRLYRSRRWSRLSQSLDDLGYAPPAPPEDAQTSDQAEDAA